MAASDYEHSVFINCPFDDQYRSLFEAIVFTVQDCGFFARCAREVSDSSQVRIEKIFKIISQCRYGIHDISRVELDPRRHLPRFNMPLELGVFLGAKRYGSRNQRRKSCLVLDRKQYRYQHFCSDIRGQDISAHNGAPKTAIRLVRDWLNDSVSDVRIPSGSIIAKRYHLFETELPIFSQSLKKIPGELTFIDFRNLAIDWLKDNPW
jgi:hypothetical protein